MKIIPAPHISIALSKILAKTDDNTVLRLSDGTRILWRSGFVYKLNGDDRPGDAGVPVHEETGLEREPIAVPFQPDKEPAPAPPADPWEHRSARMSCQTCMWFLPKRPTPHFGRCRRHAPELGGWPAVYGRDWCGDHKLDEKHA